ncbi:MAG: carbamoyltransferase family protein [Planctomycetota bacterium]|jgi:carbamoyltransferase
MKVLGIHAVTHDPSAALLIDGEVAAAADEERFTRVKHATGALPIHAVRFCLEKAGIKPKDLDVVAYPWSRDVLRRTRWKYLGTTVHRRPSRFGAVLMHPYRRQKRREKLLYNTLRQTGIDPRRVEIEFVDHHMAHAASAFYFSGFDRAAVLSIDGVGEVQTTLCAEGRGGEIVPISEVLKPDSLGLFYTTMTEYLGFKANDGEYKLMGMAPYGDSSAVDIADFIESRNGAFELNQEYVNCSRKIAHIRGKHFSRALVKRLGPPRLGDAIAPPYTHVAAATQRLFEEAAMHVVDHHLAPVLDRTGGNLAFAGGCALNVVFNRLLIQHPKVHSLYVQPNAGDGGTSLGAAAFAAKKRGDDIQPMNQVQYGPDFTIEECRKVLDRFRIPYEEPEDIIEATAQLLSEGKPVAWFHGPMEWGPRALGNRSILGNPSVKDQTNDINLRVKFREAWRPFCPSILAEHGPEVFESDHDSPFMTFCYMVRKEWKDRIPEVVHVDGSARPQYIHKEHNPRFRKLVERFHEKTGIPCVINTSLNRRGEPIVCTPEDAVRMFFGCAIEYLVLEDLLVRKKPA